MCFRPLRRQAIRELCMNDVNGRVLVVGAFRFPTGDAAAARVLGIAKSLRHGGCEVIFGGWEPRPRLVDDNGKGGFEYEGFPYVSQDEFRSGQLSALKRLLRYFLAGSNTLRWIRSMPKGSVQTVIAYQGGSLFLLRLMFLCRLRGLRLIADCTEWYDAEGLVGGRLGIVHLDNEFRMRFVNRMIGQLVVVSQFLRDYYERRGCDVIRVPPTIDLGEPKWRHVERKANSGPLRLIYAGVPGKKDLLASVLYGLRTLKNEGKMVVLDLLGPSKEDLLLCANGDHALIDDLRDVLVFHGRVPQETVPGLVSRADFSILLRPLKRVSAAGFSTKFVESLAAGVPVMANRTGDIDRFVEDGRQGILLPGVTEADFVHGVRRALALSTSELSAMRAYAMECAKEHFAYERYSESLGQFVRGGLSAGVDGS